MESYRRGGNYVILSISENMKHAYLSKCMLSTLAGYDCLIENYVIP
jgi:hypothetical protein